MLKNIKAGALLTNKISESSVLNNVDLGEDVTIWHFCNLYGCRIGDHTQIGSYCEIQSHVSIGTYCRLQARVFIPEQVKIGDYVFIGPSVTFTNDKHPTVPKTIMRTWKCEKTEVGAYTSLGANAVIGPGVTIGSGAVVGSGSCVMANVSPFSIVVGNPARKIADIRDEKYREHYLEVIKALQS